MAQPGLSSAAALLPLAAYLLALLGVTLAASRSSRRAVRGGSSGAGTGSAAEAYFLAERAVAWPAAAASLFASNIGAEHLVGLAGTGAASGTAVAFYELGAGVCLLILGYIMLPVYLSAAVATVPDYLEARYGTGARCALVFISLCLYMLTKMSATLFAGGVLLRAVGGDAAARYSPVALIALTALYTLAGGLKAVVWTEALQTVTILAGGALTLALALREAGGWGGVQAALDAEVPPDYWHMLRGAGDDEFPWTAFATGYFVVSVWYWAADQEIAQRVLAARGLAHGQAACVAAAFLKLAPGPLMVLPGIISRALQKQRGEGVYAPGAARDEADFDAALPWLVLNVLPPAARGVVVAAMLAALMSSLASVFNSSATLLSVSVWHKLRPQASEASLVLVGRVGVAAVAMLSVAWLPIIPLLGSQLFIYVQRPPSYIAPPVLALYVWGMAPLPPRMQPEAFGAGVCLLLGVGAGAVRFIAEVAAGVAGRDERAALGWYTRMHFQHFAALSFVFSSAVLLAAEPLRNAWRHYRAGGGRWGRLENCQAEGIEASNGIRFPSDDGGTVGDTAVSSPSADRARLLWRRELRARVMAQEAAHASEGEESEALTTVTGTADGIADADSDDGGGTTHSARLEPLEIEAGRDGGLIDDCGARSGRRVCFGLASDWLTCGDMPPRARRRAIDVAAVLYALAFAACMWLFG